MKFIFSLCLFAIGFSAHAKDLSTVFAKVNPAVVVIYTEGSVNTKNGDGIRTDKAQGIGSGVIISKDGLIMTAAHVVNSADLVYVQLHNDKRYRAKVLSTSVATDLGLIQLEELPQKLSYIKPWDSDKVKIGEEVFVIGAPYGLEHTLTAGHLSGRRTDSGDDALVDLEFLQTDAGVNMGNSGGPMFNKDGKLIGIISHIQSQSGGNEGLGFAASINMAKRVLLDESPLWLGMDFVPLKRELAHAFNVPYNEGLLVQSVAKGSFGDALNIIPSTIPILLGDRKIRIGGDVVVEIGGNSVYVNRKGRQRLADYLANVPSGENIEVTVIREGKRVVLSAAKP